MVNEEWMTEHSVKMLRYLVVKNTEPVEVGLHPHCRGMAQYPGLI
jgi:hypothetical protein